VLARMWRKGNPLLLLMGMRTSAATMKNSMEVPQKVKNRTHIRSSNHTTGFSPQNTKTLIQRDTCTPMCTAALSIIAKLWKQPKCPVTDEWIKKWCVCMCISISIYVSVYVYWNIIQP